MADPPVVLGALDPDVPVPFGRDSVVRAVVAEPVTALLVQRALVLEVAHPKVAAGVSQHSTFQRRPWSRAAVTADAALRLVFGDDATARAAVAQIYRVHDGINGPVGVPVADAGTDARDTYSAHDAALLAWVWATLVDTAETAYTRWVRPLSPAEADAFYGEMRAFGRFFGIAGHLLPEDRAAFAAYMEDTLAEESFASGALSRSLARDVLWFSHWSVPAPLVRVERALALATLDRRVLERLRIRPSPAELEDARRLERVLAHYRRLPRAPRVMPSLYVRLRALTAGLVDSAQAWRAPR